MNYLSELTDFTMMTVLSDRHSKKLPNIFNQHFRYASEVHTYNTRYASKSNFYKPRSRTNIGKQTTVAMATELLQQVPTHIKDLSTYNSPKGTPFTNVQNSKPRIQCIVAYEVSKVAEFFIVFPGGGFFGKTKARWNFLFPFLKIVHQKGLLGRIK